MEIQLKISSNFLALLLSLMLFCCLFQNSLSVQNEQQQKAAANAKRRLKVVVYTNSIGWSHNQFLGKIADDLAEAGHEVHFVKQMLNPSFANRNETKRVYKVHRLMPRHRVTDNTADIAQQMDSNSDPFSGKHFNLLSALDWNFQQLVDVVVEICQTLLQDDQLIEELAGKHFDIGISEAFDSCPLAFFHRIGVKTTLGAFAIPLLQPMARPFGIPAFSSFVPEGLGAAYPPDMNFWHRLINFYNAFYNWKSWNDKFDSNERLLIESAFGTDFPSKEELFRNISMVFINANPFLEFPRPISNKLVYIGGIVDQGRETGKLDEKVQYLLESSKRGAVLVSFGSIPDTRKMPAPMREAMFSAFAHFPDYQFIWKYHNQSAAEREQFDYATNVHTFQWFDQMAILKHPKLRAFVSHCGQNSVNEASRAGVPIVGIPLFADQQYNAVLTQYKGMGVHLDVRALSGPGGRELLIQALEKVLHNSSYTDNARLLSRKQALTPFSASERLVKWVEFAAEFPPLKEFNLPDDQQMHWFVYFSLDVILVSLVAACAIILTFTLLLYTLLSRSFPLMRLAIKKADGELMRSLMKNGKLKSN